jgi:hypothetical protein
MHATTLWIFFFQILGFEFKARGCRTRVINSLFFKFLENESTRFKTILTLSLILRFNLNLGGYSIWSASLIAPYIKKDLKNTRDMSTSHPQYSQESTRKILSRRSSEELEDGFKSTWKPTVLGYEGGLSWIHP